MQDLERLQWPQFTCQESDVVVDSSYTHGSKVVIGGSANIVKKKIDASVNAGEYVLYWNFLHSRLKSGPGVTFVLKVTEEGETMSVLLLGDDPLVWRRCEGEYAYDLCDWFASVEMHAWARVEAYHERPKEIFLVLGQHLTSSYGICHKKYGSFECEVIFEASGGLPSVANVSLLGSYGITKAYASVGFEDVVTKSSEENPITYSMFLNTYAPKSGPLQRFKRSLQVRAQEQYR